MYLHYQKEKMKSFGEMASEPMYAAIFGAIVGFIAKWLDNRLSNKKGTILNYAKSMAFGAAIIALYVYLSKIMSRGNVGRSTTKPSGFARQSLGAAPRGTPFGGPQASFGGPQASFGGPQASFGGPQASFGGPQASFGGPQASFGETPRAAPIASFGGNRF